MQNLKKNIKFIVVAVGVILVWRGGWGLADLFLFPDDPKISFLTSIFIGLFILLMTDFSKKDLSELN